MPNKISKIISSFLVGPLFTLLNVSMLITGCGSKYTSAPVAIPFYEQVNLVTDITGQGTSRVDANLLNPWGIAISSTGTFCISANHSGAGVIYDNNGQQLFAPPSIPTGFLVPSPGNSPPTGVVYAPAFTGTSLYGPSTFIFATEDGMISSWNTVSEVSVMATVTMADKSSTGAVYKGLALATDGGESFLYATDFHNGKIDVFNSNVVSVNTKPFIDPGIPAGFAPFNIQNIGGLLYVTYAKQSAPDNEDDSPGAGNGFVNIFTPGGIFVKRFATQGTLNSPWGITQVPSAATSFGQVANAILIGNFGDGHINVFNSNGTYQGQLINNSAPVCIPGLWAITFDTSSKADPNRLYFTAGPGDEAHGLFGYLKKM